MNYIKKKSKINFEVVLITSFLIVILFFGSSLCSFVQVQNISMEKTLYSGDVVFVLKKNINLFNKNLKVFDVKKNDILVFHKFDTTRFGVKQKYYIKRCVGLPNEVITNSLTSDYQKDIWIPANNYSIPQFMEFLPMHEGLLQLYEKRNRNHDCFRSYKYTNNYYYLVGDNRKFSNDSRHWGCIPEKNISGRAIFIVCSIKEIFDGKIKYRTNRFFLRIRKYKST